MHGKIIRQLAIKIVMVYTNTNVRLVRLALLSQQTSSRAPWTTNRQLELPELLGNTAESSYVYVYVYVMSHGYVGMVRRLQHSAHAQLSPPATRPCPIALL